MSEVAEPTGGVNLDGIKFTRDAISRNLRNAYKVSLTHVKSSILLYIITWTCCHIIKHAVLPEQHRKRLENTSGLTVYPRHELS